MSRALPLLAVVFSAAGALAQQPPRFATEVRQVELDVSVTRDNRPVAGLGAGDFEVKDAGVLQSVEVVEHARARVHAILLLDTSGSVAGEKLQQLTQAARAFAEGLAPEDAVTLLCFSYRVLLLGEPAGSPQSAVSALSRLRAGGTTALIDAAAAATALADARRGRPLVLVFSDGEDRVSFLRERQALDAARHSDVVFHAVGFAPARAGARERIGALPNQRLQLEGSPGFLEHLTEATGGRLWSANTPQDLAGAFRSVLEEVRERYLLRYEPVGVPAPAGTRWRCTCEGRGSWSAAGPATRRSAQGPDPPEPPRAPPTPLCGKWLRALEAFPGRVSSE